MKKFLAFGTIALACASLVGCAGGSGGTSSGGGGGGGVSTERTAVNDTEGGRPRIWVHDIASGSFLLQAESSTARNEMPALSPDSRKIAFISNRSGSDELYVMTVNQPGTLQRLTTDATIDTAPAWISNTKLVWSKFVGGPDSEIVTMNLDGTGFTQLTNNDVDDKLPAVSKDGSQLAFLRSEGGETHVIYSLPTSGGVPTLVHRHQSNRPSVSWLDNSNLLFTARDAGVENCMRISSAGGAPTKITEGWGPKVSPSGGRIMLARLVAGKSELFTTTLTGSDARQYTFTAEGVFAWDWRG